MPHPLISELETELSAHANSKIAEQQTAYMKNHFAFYGIPKPVRSEIIKPLFKKYILTSEHELITLMEYLWQQEFRELHYYAIDIAEHYKNLWTPKMLIVFEKLITQRSWWDSVDGLTALVGKLILKYPELLVSMDTWIDDPNMWLRRSAIISQRSFKNKTDQTRLFNYCKTCIHEKEFFIRKAIGWALREYSKVNPKAVAQFIAEHSTELSTLSKREGSKYI